MLYRDSWIEIDLTAFKENIAYLKKMTQKKFIAVIKANGYGNGDVSIAFSALEAKADLLAVSSLDEALALRNENIQSELLVLGYVDPEFVSIVKLHNITLTVVSLDWVKKMVVQDCAGVKVQIKIDTGMNRIGLKQNEEIKEAYELMKSSGIQIEGVFTHFACSDISNNIMTDLQMNRFQQALDILGTDYKWIHTSNSDATIHYKESFSNCTRCGIAMFGISSYKTSLKSVMSLKSKVICVKEIKKGETVGYGATYTASQDEWIATIPIGYADGWLRKHQGRYAYIGDIPCEFIGRICMDQCMIRVPEGTQVHEIVELIGSHMPITQVAHELDTIPYEIMTGLSDRLAKVYVENGQSTKTVNPRFDHHTKL